MTEKLKEKIGHVQVANEVVAAIAGLAATDVKGVSALYGGITHDEITRSGMKKLRKGIDLEMTGDGAKLGVSIVLDGTVGIPEVSKAVTNQVRDRVEDMIGIPVQSVEVKIAGVNV